MQKTLVASFNHKLLAALFDQSESSAADYALQRLFVSQNELAAVNTNLGLDL
jgi:hypothetical protein